MVYRIKVNKGKVPKNCPFWISPILDFPQIFKMFDKPQAYILLSEGSANCEQMGKFDV